MRTETIRDATHTAVFLYSKHICLGGATTTSNRAGRDALAQTTISKTMRGTYTATKLLVSQTMRVARMLPARSGGPAGAIQAPIRVGCIAPPAPPPPSTTVRWHGGPAVTADAPTVTVNFLQPDGTTRRVDARVGESLLQTAHRYDIDLEGACEGGTRPRSSKAEVIVDEKSAVCAAVVWRRRRSGRRMGSSLMPRSTRRSIQSARQIHFSHLISLCSSSFLLFRFR